jgi:hypothetical protein
VGWAGAGFANLILLTFSLSQLVNAHANVKPKGWGVLNIPSPEEIPGIDLQVMVRDISVLEHVLAVTDLT